MTEVYAKHASFSVYYNYKKSKVM